MFLFFVCIISDVHSMGTWLSFIQEGSRKNWYWTLWDSCEGWPTILTILLLLSLNLCWCIGPLICRVISLKPPWAILKSLMHNLQWALFPLWTCSDPNWKFTWNLELSSSLTLLLGCRTTRTLTRTRICHINMRLGRGTLPGCPLTFLGLPRLLSCSIQVAGEKRPLFCSLA